MKLAAEWRSCILQGVLFLFLGSLHVACTHDQNQGGRLRLSRDTNKDGFEDLTAEYDSNGDLRRLALDVNRDGEPEIQGWYQQGRLQRLVKMIEVDANLDGRIDRWERYADGKLVEVRSDNDDDGQPDQWERFDSSGRLIFIGFDTDRDGKPDRTLEPGAATD